jgi:hypothetical protein
VPCRGGGGGAGARVTGPAAGCSRGAAAWRDVVPRWCGVAAAAAAAAADGARCRHKPPHLLHILHNRLGQARLGGQAQQAVCQLSNGVDLGGCEVWGEVRGWVRAAAAGQVRLFFLGASHARTIRRWPEPGGVGQGSSAASETYRAWARAWGWGWGWARPWGSWWPWRRAAGSWRRGRPWGWGWAGQPGWRPGWLRAPAARGPRLRRWSGAAPWPPRPPCMCPWQRRWPSSTPRRSSCPPPAGGGWRLHSWQMCRAASRAPWQAGQLGNCYC